MEDQKPYTVPHPERQRTPVDLGLRHTEIQPATTRTITVRRWVTLERSDGPDDGDGMAVMCWDEPAHVWGVPIAGKWVDFEFEVPRKET